jgi:hypothetical protein
MEPDVKNVVIDENQQQPKYKRIIRRPRPQDTAVTQRNTTGQKRSRDATEENNTDTTSVQNVFKKLTRNYIYGDNAYIRMYDNIDELNNAYKSNYNDERFQYAEKMNFNKKNPELFLYIPTGTVFLFIARHGIYQIPNIKYHIAPCEVNNLIMYSHAPKGACSWSNHHLDVCRYTRLYNDLRDVSDVTQSNIESLTSKLNTLARNNQCDVNYHETQQVAVRYPNRDIYFHSDDANRITFSHLGDYIVNKMYVTETEKNLTSGVAILFDITFRLPDIFFKSDKNRTILNNALSVNWQKNFKTGIYNESTQMITYEKNTELLSCPYFIAYLTLFYRTVTIVDAYSIVDSIDDRTGPITVRRKMLYNCYSYDIYSYFKYVNTVVNIDFSCGAFDVINPDKETKIIDDATKEKVNYFEHAEKLGIHGGGKTNKYKTKSRKKQKNRKQKTKHRKQN